eukprot:sb/3476468/
MTAATVGVLKKAKMVEMAPQRQTAYNLKRKADGRQVGEEGDIERLKGLLKSKQDTDPGFSVTISDSPLRVIIQTCFMKDMMARYGGMTVFLDATHQITRYRDIALLILAVRTTRSFR